VSLSFRVAVHVGVMLGRLFRVMLGMKRMTVGYVAMVSGLLMVSGLVMFRRGAMMARGVLVVFCCFTMMFSALFRHRILSWRSAMRRDDGPRLRIAGHRYGHVTR